MHPAILIAVLAAYPLGYLLQRRYKPTMKVALVLLGLGALSIFIPAFASLNGALFAGALIFGWGTTHAERKNERDKLKVGRPAFRFCPNCATRLAEREFEGKKKLACPFCTYVHWNNPIHVAVALVPHRDGLVLVKRKVEPKVGMWAMPAGYLETGEGPEAAAVREAKEEAGIDIEIERHLVNLPLPAVNQVLMVFLAKPIDQTPMPGSDAEKAEVFPLDALPADIAFPLHKKVIEEWRDSLKPAG